MSIVLTNKTINQHFLSQVEQRLNAINPNSPSESQRIYSFSIIDRENYSIQIDSEKGKKIENNLSSDDLFSFDVVNKNLRYNFEEIFNRYEKNIKIYTERLLDKLVNKRSQDIKKEIINIFIAKDLNFFRNPYNIKKMLNTIGIMNKYIPTNPDLSDAYKKLIEGNRPQQKYVCSTFGISKSEYEEWLHAMFMLLYPELNQHNILEDISKSLFEQDSYFITVTIFNYTLEHKDKRCLLSDRGFVTPLPEDQCLSYAYNLCSNAFILYNFLDIEKHVPQIPPNRIDLYKRSPKCIHVNYKENDLEALSIYNHHVVYQSHSKVYSSNKCIYGLI